MLTFLLWCVLLIFCWPVALLALVLYPIVWVLLLPFRIVGIAVEGVLGCSVPFFCFRSGYWQVREESRGRNKLSLKAQMFAHLAHAPRISKILSSPPKRAFRAKSLIPKQKNFENK